MHDIRFSGLFLGLPTADICGHVKYLVAYFEFILVTLVCLSKHCFSIALMPPAFLDLSYCVEIFPFIARLLD